MSAEPTIEVTIKIPVNFDRRLTFTITPKDLQPAPELEPEPPPPNQAEPQGGVGT